MGALAEIGVVGAGGIGSPLLLALARLPAHRVRLFDDDVVEESNLHRQIAFENQHIGERKAPLLKAAAIDAGYGAEAISVHNARILPESAAEQLAGLDLVVDASDNFPTRFLLADACHVLGIPLVTVAALGWQATCFSRLDPDGACYRCLFEDVPAGDLPTCASGGVAGPVCGIAAALACEQVSRWLEGGQSAGNQISFDGLSSKFRQRLIQPRADCTLCAAEAPVPSLKREHYLGAAQA